MARATPCRLPFLVALSLALCSAADLAASGTAPPGAEPKRVAFTHVNLVPMTREVVLPDHTVVVVGTRISALGPSREVSVPADAATIDGTGAYLMPGLADMHIHTQQNWPSWPMPPTHLYLAHGVTTVRDMGTKGDNPGYVLGWRTEIEAARSAGPTIYSAGPTIYGFEDDVVGAVRSRHQAGFDFVKFYSFLSPGQFRAAAAEARRLGLHAAGHIPFPLRLAGALDAGLDEVAHIEELTVEWVGFDRSKRFPPREWYAYIARHANVQFGGYFGGTDGELEEAFAARFEETAQTLIRSGTPVCTTLVVDQVIVRKVFDLPAFLTDSGLRYLPASYRQAVRRGEEKHLQQFKGLGDFANFKFRADRLLLSGLSQAGVTVLLGTDSGSGDMGLVPGLSIHDELAILVASGLSPYQAIRSGTAAASKVVERMIGTDAFGTVEVGKRADLLLVEDNPLEDVAHLRRLRGVMARGRWFPQDVLAQMVALEP